MRGDAARRARGHALGCPLPASLGQITSFSKKPSFLGNHSKYVGKGQPRPRQPPLGTQPRARQPPMGGEPRPWHAAAKAKATPMGAGSKAPGGRQPRPLGARWHAPGCTQQGPWGARWHAPGGRQQGPWGHAARALACMLLEGQRHALWVGCQGRGMPLGPLEGHGSTWGGCCCQALIASSDTSYSSPPKERLGKNQLWHEETLIC